MTSLKAGEFLRSTIPTQAAWTVKDEYVNFSIGGTVTGFAPFRSIDARAAAEALLALADELETEYVELCEEYRLRIRGEDVVQELKLATGWVVAHSQTAADAYRAGIAKGQQS